MKKITSEPSFKIQKRLILWQAQYMGRKYCYLNIAINDLGSGFVDSMMKILRSAMEADSFSIN